MVRTDSSARPALRRLECRNCLGRMTTRGHVGHCPGCGGRMRNVAVARE